MTQVKSDHIFLMLCSGGNLEHVMMAYRDKPNLSKAISHSLMPSCRKVFHWLLTVNAPMYYDTWLDVMECPDALDLTRSLKEAGYSLEHATMTASASHNKQVLDYCTKQNGWTSDLFDAMLCKNPYDDNQHFEMFKWAFETANIPMTLMPEFLHERATKCNIKVAQFIESQMA